MKTSNKIITGQTVLSVLILGGCATTPQGALDQANNGAALTMSLQAEIVRFRSIETTVMKARVALIKEQQISLAQYDSLRAFDDRIATAAGNGGPKTLETQLSDLADSRQKDEAALNAKIADLTATYDKLLTALPDPSGNLTATQKALAKMGDQLSVKDQISIVASFAKGIKQSIEDNKKKIEDAKVSADAQASPAQKNPDQN